MKLTRIRRRGGRLSKDWYVDYTVLGRRVRLRIGPNKRRAELVLAEIQLRMARGELGDLMPEVRTVTRRRFDAYADEYHEKTKISYRASTWSRNKSRIGILKAFFGETLVDEIDKPLVEEFRRSRDRDGVSASTINHEVTLLRRMLNVAAEWGYTAQPPAWRLKALSTASEPFLPPSKEQIRDLLAACSVSRNKSLRDMVLVALYAGLRRAEVFNLQWRDIDFKRASLRVVSREAHLTKNTRSRSIPLHADLATALESRKTNGSAKSPTDLVFPGVDGRPIENISKSWVTARKRAGLPNLRYHDLRHVFASYLVTAGQSLRLVQELLGHRSLDMVQRYSHLRPEATRSAIDGLEFRDRAPVYRLSAAHCDPDTGPQLDVPSAGETCRCTSAPLTTRYTLRPASRPLLDRLCRFLSKTATATGA